MVASPDSSVPVQFALLLAAEGPNLGRAAGRLHPLFVHFPIALGLVAAGCEWWRTVSRRGGMSPLTPTLLWIAAAGAAASTASGWVNAAFERANDESDELALHRWLATATAVLFVVIAFWCQRLAREAMARGANAAGRVEVFRWGLLAGAILMSISGHIGGGLVHGSDYFFETLTSPAEKPEEAPKETAAVKLTANEQLFVEKVRPIFEAHCFECHGSKKQKGGLRMDSKAWLFNGSEEKWTVQPKRAGESLMIHRVELDRLDPDAMPPEGDGLTADEKAVLRQWIDAGADYPDMTVAAAAAPGAAGGGSAASAGAASAAEDIPQALRTKAAAAAEALIARGVLVQPLAIDNPLFDVNATRADPPIGDADAALFADLAPLVANLNLAKSALTDAGVAKLGSLARVERLRLDGTAIGDDGVRALGSLARLESINLIGTKVTGASASWLMSQPALRRVYIWQTALDTPDTVKSLNAGGKLQAIGADLPLAQPKGPPMPEDPKPEAPKEEAPKPEEKKG
ncbi:MAG: hypothetical protein RLZZ116_2472 [Planctomycetota bacterium]|jgi:uncharacterized membrane protein